MIQKLYSSNIFFITRSNHQCIPSYDLLYNTYDLCWKWLRSMSFNRDRLRSTKRCCEDIYRCGANKKKCKHFVWNIPPFCYANIWNAYACALYVGFELHCLISRASYTLNAGLTWLWTPRLDFHQASACVVILNDLDMNCDAAWA